MFLCSFFSSFYFPVPPQIHPFDFGDEAINSGDLVIATCAVSKGDFPITIRWSLNNKPLDNVDGITVLSTNKRVSQLTIESVQAHHSGEYKCIAKNKAGVIDFSAYLNVNGMVTILIVFFLPSPTTNFTLRFWRRSI